MSSSGQEETDPTGREPEAGGPEGAEGEEAGAALIDDPTLELQGRVLELEARLRSVSSAYRQKQEEIENTKERLARQAAVQEEVRRGEVVASLFEPVENLHRSIEAVKGSASEGGLRMVYHQFMDAMKRLGLEEVPGVGSKFDPGVHEAIASTPVADVLQDNLVVSVYSAGYRIGARLVRPARVIIGTYTPPVAEA